jgi:hypothetical protein
LPETASDAARREERGAVPDEDALPEQDLDRRVPGQATRLQHRGTQDCTICFPLIVYYFHFLPSLPSDVQVLKEYCKLIPIDESTTLVHGIRQFLESFRCGSFSFLFLPCKIIFSSFFSQSLAFRPMGESPVIERYLECFLDHFLAHNHRIEATLDDVFSLTYSVIMLNVELHSPTLIDKPKMTLVRQGAMSNFIYLVESIFYLHFIFSFSFIVFDILCFTNLLV